MELIGNVKPKNLSMFRVKSAVVENTYRLPDMLYLVIPDMLYLPRPKTRTTKTLTTKGHM
jgi:hypothetical protein